MAVIQIKTAQLSRYEELSRLLRRQIEEGRYRPGDQIPTELELVRKYDVSRTTIRQAVAILEQEGYLTRRRGAGTFVLDLCEQGRPILPLKTMGFLLVDLPPIANDPWTTFTTRTAHEVLAARDAHRSIWHFSTTDLLKNKRPPVFQEGNCQAVVLDGWITEAHCGLLDQQRLPYFVLGNHHVNRTRPQAFYNFKEMAVNAVNYLQNLRPNQPIVVFLEPFLLAFTHDFYHACAKATYNLPQRHPILQTAADEEVAVVFEEMLKRFDGPFSLIITDQHWRLAFGAYQRQQLSTEEWPVVVLGDPDILSPTERAACHVLPMNGRRLVQEALPSFLDAYERGQTDSFYMELSSQPILPPR